MSERQVMIAVVRQHLLRAQQRMKLQADKKRSERSFSVGDMVYLKLQPYVQSSLAPRAHQKLSFRYFGPYKTLEAIGTVAYKLELPPGSSIHPVFHVSLLKPAPPHKSQVSADIPESDFGLQVPELILTRRLHPRQNGAVAQVLVKWSNMDVDLATWEDAEALHQKFPLAPAWGHAGSQGEGVSAPFHLRHLKTLGLEGVNDAGPGALESSAHNGQASAVPASQLRISSAKARRRDKLVNIKPISIILLLLNRPSSVRYSYRC